jgi:hypothetical protein
MTFGKYFDKGSGYLSVHICKEINRKEGLLYSKFEPRQILKKNVATYVGREWAFNQLYSNETSASATGGANWIGLSQNGDPVYQSQTTLTGEITTNGLARYQGEVSHIADTNVAIIDNVFTASGANFDEPGIRKGGLFYQNSGGNAVHLGKIQPTVPVLDTQSIKVTGTVNINIPT